MLRRLPKRTLWEELRRDPAFAGNVYKNLALTLCIKCEEICWRLGELASLVSLFSLGRETCGSNTKKPLR